MEIENLREAIRHLHGCESRHVETSYVRETMPDGSTVVWEGPVDVFELLGHATATQAYAWPYWIDRKADRRGYVAVIGTEVVDTPTKAVQVWLVDESRKRA